MINIPAGELVNGLWRSSFIKMDYQHWEEVHIMSGCEQHVLSDNCLSKNLVKDLRDT